MDKRKLNTIIKKHQKWLTGKSGGERADLSGADLSGADLPGANLSWANLSWADLPGANLSRANLPGADLSGANLSRADLPGANLSRANLSRADLSRADLSGADLSWANLSWANLDFSCWPLHCGSFGAKVDNRLIAQLVAHITRLNVAEPNGATKGIMSALEAYANEFCQYRQDVAKVPAPRPEADAAKGGD